MSKKIYKILGVALKQFKKSGSSSTAPESRIFFVGKIQLTLNSSHGVTIIFNAEQLLLLANPSLLLLDLGQEVLVRQRFFQLLTSGRGEAFKLGPRLVEGLQALLDLWHAKIGHVHEFLSRLLHRLYGGFVRGQLGFQTLVLLPQVLDAGEVAAVIVRADQQFLFPTSKNS